MAIPRKPSLGGYPVARKRRRQATQQVKEVDHKNLALLNRHLSEFGQIENRKRSGNSPVSQRVIARAIKRARILALLPFIKQ